MRKTVGDSFLARRDLLKLGGYGLLGAFADQALWPVAARAAGKADPRGTARFGIIVELAGAISHTDTFDFKENAGTPKDLDVRPVNNNNLYLSHRLFPELSQEMHRIAIVRSLSRVSPPSPFGDGQQPESRTRRHGGVWRCDGVARRALSPAGRARQGHGAQSPGA